MNYPVRLFARARDLAGSDTLSVELPEGSTVAQLRQAVSLTCPALGSLVLRCAVALDGEFAQDQDILPPGSEIALLPPVSGG